MRRLAALAGAVVCALLAVVAVGAGVSHATTTSPGGGSAVTKSETIVRENLVNGKEDLVDKRSVTVHVSATQNLRGRQEISVSWSGAHPTGGIVADQNSIDAQEEEYPMVLLECRGTSSSPSVKAIDRLSPQTCWTQDWSERYQDSFATEFPPYRLDQFATTPDRSQVADAPSPLPSSCEYLPAPTQHWVPFIAADGHTYYEGPAGCAGEPPEAQNVEGSGFPSNETFGVTGLDGKGTADFDIWTSEENASLGCSTTVPCSLVAVPIMGISCDPQAKGLPVDDRPPASQEAAAAKLCEEKGAFAPGQIVTPEGNDDLAVSGSLWWSASNWKNRIVVPLTFAVPASACAVVGSKNTVDVYGSELLIGATSQWGPHFCLNKNLFTLEHVQTGEPEARNFLALGTSDAAFTSDAQSGGYGKPVVNAPTAVTGFAISYDIDGANGQPYTKLRLTPLLLAKLLTESYPAELPVQEEFPALEHNPLNITDDPEFIQLNPGITHGVSATEAASELVSLSSDSDVIEALTTYINDNPEARAWLNGKPDKWGMVVNPAYKGIKLPVDQWPLRSQFEPKQWYASDQNNCLYNDPVPYLPLVSAPMASLEDITEALQFDVANSTTVCSQIDGTTVGEKLVAQGPQTDGYRFLIGITPLADDSQYGLSAAALETSPNHFVTPTAASLKAAVSLLRPNEKAGLWPIPYTTLASKAGADAYPGTMVVYTAVPTTGLPAATAKDLSEFLEFAVTSGQTPGLGVGQLPPGYLPMTAADGLGFLQSYAEQAAADVAAQNGKVPSLVSSGGGTTTTTTTVPGGSTGTTQPYGTTPYSQGTPPAQTTPPGGTTAPTGHHTTTTTPPATVLSAIGRTIALALGTGEGLVVLVFGLALLGLLGAPTVFVVGRRRGRW